MADAVHPEQPSWYSEPWRNRAAALALLRATEDVVGEDSMHERAKPEAAAYRAWLTEKCKTDLLFLGRLLGYSKILDRVHLPVAALAPDKSAACAIIAREHEADDPNALPASGVIRETEHFDPRGVFKTTLGVADCVQWIVNLPNIRICVLTATKPLAAAIAGEIADHFVRGRGDKIFQELFRDFCIAERDKRLAEFTAVCRTRHWREATVMAFSIETSISGWHFDVLHVDDVVDTQNSSTAAGIEKVKKNYRINHKTLMPWGYTNCKGTRYSPFDLWGDLLDKARPNRTRVLVRAALRLKSGARLEPGAFPEAEAMELLFPELLSYEFLKQEFEDDYSSFMTQYMNDAQGGHAVIFNRETLLAAIQPAGRAPVIGPVRCAWRLACPSKPGMKYDAGAAGIMAEGRLWVLGVERGMFTPSSLAHRVVKLAKDHGTHTVELEATPGARHAEAAILNYAAALGWAVQVQWTEFEEDDGLRGARLRACEPLLVGRRLVFSDGMGEGPLGELVKQFTHCGMIEENEIVDVVARLAAQLPRLVQVEEPDMEQALAWQLAAEREMHDRIHGIGRFAPREPVAPEPAHRRGNELGLEEIMPGLNG